MDGSGLYAQGSLPPPLGRGRQVRARTRLRSCGAGRDPGRLGNMEGHSHFDPNENNLWFQFQRDRPRHLEGGDFMVPLMVADADPRLPMYFSNATGGGYAPRDSELSTTGYGAPTFDVPLLSCAENAFTIAEAQFAVPNEAGAISAAQDGLTCQEDEWSVRSFSSSGDDRGPRRSSAPGRDHGPEVHRVVPERGGVQRLQAHLPAGHHGASGWHARPAPSTGRMSASRTPTCRAGAAANPERQRPCRLLAGVNTTVGLVVLL